MSVVDPLPKEKAASESHVIYDGVSKKFGKMPNIFGLMTHRPDVLVKFLPFFPLPSKAAPWRRATKSWPQAARVDRTLNRTPSACCK